ncbi:MAG TPA: hypothetical protein VFG22_18845 [Polyangiales bacterium]|nr:hypothetical protein [Polyangiales bacterium]
MSTSHRVTRRVFVTSLLGAAALTAGAGVWHWDSLRREWIVRKLIDHFDYLDIDPAGVSRFVDTFERHQYPIRRNPLKLLFRPLPDEIYMNYLSSTDFFINGADESRPVRFVALYDPYVSPCYNPFRRVQA